MEIIQYTEFLIENEEWVLKLVEEFNETKAKKEQVQNEVKVLIQRLDAVKNVKKNFNGDEDSLKYFEKVYQMVLRDCDNKEKELEELETLNKSQIDLIDGLNKFKEECYPVK